jgi:hypothetical protein
VVSRSRPPSCGAGRGRLRRAGSRQPISCTFKIGRPPPRCGGYSFSPGASVFSGLWAGLAGSASSVLAPARRQAGRGRPPNAGRRSARAWARAPRVCCCDVHSLSDNRHVRTCRAIRVPPKAAVWIKASKGRCGLFVSGRRCLGPIEHYRLGARAFIAKVEAKALSHQRPPRAGPRRARSQCPARRCFGVFVGVVGQV